MGSGGGKMEIDMEKIEEIASERLRSLSLGEDIYNEDFVECLEDNDEISSEEAGFMRGYLDFWE